VSDTVLYEQRGRIAIVTINRPEAMNAIDPETAELLTRTWERVRDDDDVWVAILTGTGRSFCAGADLKKMIPAATERAREGGQRRDPVIPGGAPWLKAFDLWKPVVAAINGYCLAGGMEMVQGTDIRIASDRATFGLTEVRRGLFPGGGSAVRMPRQIPYAFAMEILLTGDSFSAEDAHRMGFVNRVVPHEDLMTEAMAFAERLAANPPVSVQAIKQAVHRCLSLPIEQGYHEEQHHWLVAFQSEDAREGPRAFAEKREPEWKGR
jgi:enoyl-CoA hydratase